MITIGFSTFAGLLSVVVICILVTALIVFVAFMGTVAIAIVGRVFGFAFGVFGDLWRILGGTFVAVGLIPLVLLSVMFGRWQAAEHYGIGVRRGASKVGRALYSVFIRRPLRLLFLDGSKRRSLAQSPNAVAARTTGSVVRGAGKMMFPGYEVVGTLPPGGSGAKLYIAAPDERTRDRLAGSPEQVVIKSFGLVDGSSLPQIVRESRSLDSARSLGLVLDHQLDDQSFWYAMPYHAGDHLGEVVRRTHEASDGDGLRNDALRRILGFETDLLETLDRYHGHGLWHKDVKPENIIVHDGAAHLVDFGLVTSLRSAMTLTTHGTEYFRDPEMVRMAMRGVKVHEVEGGRFDVYGAGAVLYFMLENTFPGHGGLSRFGRPSPEALRWIVRRAMTDYERRYATAADMLEDLRFVAEQPDPWALPPASLPSVRREGSNDAALESEPVVSRSTLPPSAVRARDSRNARPRLEIINWWTGAYRLAGDEGIASITQGSAIAVGERNDRGPGLGPVLVGLMLSFTLAFAIALWTTGGGVRTGWFTEDADVDGVVVLAERDGTVAQVLAGDVQDVLPSPSEAMGMVILKIDSVDESAEGRLVLGRLEEGLNRVGWTSRSNDTDLEEAMYFADLHALSGGFVDGPVLEKTSRSLRERGIGGVAVLEEGDGGYAVTLFLVDGRTVFVGGVGEAGD